MKKQGPTHSPEHVHSFTFHFFCLSRENLSSENGRKTRSEMGGREILPHLREIVHVLYMYEIVRLCFTCFVLEVCSKDQRIRTLMLKQEARVFWTQSWPKVEDSVSLGWAFVVLSFHTIPFGLHPPEPIYSFFDIFDFFLFCWLCLFFLMPFKN